MGDPTMAAFNAVAEANPFYNHSRGSTAVVGALVFLQVGFQYLWTGMLELSRRYGAQQLAGSAGVRSYWSGWYGFC